MTSATMNIKANSPPPAYAALPPEPATSSQRQIPPPLPSPYGPNLQPSLLPGDADERALWRFVGALICGLGLLGK